MVSNPVKSLMFWASIEGGGLPSTVLLSSSARDAGSVIASVVISNKAH